MSSPIQTLKIVRQLAHERSRVFSALTDPAKMNRWFFAKKGDVTVVTNELRPGGKYVIKTGGKSAEDSPHGTYLEILPPEKIVFSWVPCYGGFESKVTIELVEREGGAATTLIITHELPEAAVEGHRGGWNVCFDHLEEFLAGSGEGKVAGGE